MKLNYAQRFALHVVAPDLRLHIYHVSLVVFFMFWGNDIISTMYVSFGVVLMP